jgi:hypothetical protein
MFIFLFGGGPKIHISAVKKKDEYLFTVKDNGIGMLSKHLEQIFTIFKRLHTHDEYKALELALQLHKKSSPNKVDRSGPNQKLVKVQHSISPFQLLNDNILF